MSLRLQIHSRKFLFGGGYVPGSNVADIDYLEIQSQGNAVSFGDLTSARREFGASSEWSWRIRLMAVPQQIPEGAIRFNTDSSKMEVWIGDKWMQVVCL